MGISLFGLTPAATYPSLIKFGDNSAISGTLRALSDGLGTDLPIQVSTAGVNFTGTASIGGTAIVTNASGVSGAIQFSNGSAFASDATQLFWDNTNKRLALGTNAPAYTFDLQSTSADPLRFKTTASYFRAIFQNAGSSGIFDFNSTNFQFPTNSVDFGTSTALGARVGIRGSGSTSATTSLLVQNSSGATLLSLRDDKVVDFNGSSILNIGTLYSNAVALGFINSSGNTYTVMRTNNSTGNATFDYSVAIGTTTAPTSRLQVVGSGSTSATTSLLVQNSAGATSFTVKDDQSATCSGLLQGGNVVSIANMNFGNILYGNNFWSQNDGGTTIGAQAAPVASAILDIRSTTRGFLPPRMTTTQRDAIVTPATGLKIYNTTLGTTDTYDGATWQRFGQQTLIKGSGSTSATTSLLVQNSAGNTALQVLDDRSFVVGNFGANGAGLGILAGNPTGAGVGGGINFNFNNGVAFNDDTNNSALKITYNGGVRIPNSSRYPLTLGADTKAVASAQLEMVSTTQGFLPPRMTTAQRNAIASPAAGLIVFDTDLQNLCYRRDGVWVQVSFTAA